MAYKVIITPHAKRQLELYISYTLKEFKNMQVAQTIRDDAKETKKRLSNVARNLALCEDEVLARNGYRKINFSKHDFFMVYRIDNDIVVVEAMYHELQDYEAVFAEKMHLK